MDFVLQLEYVADQDDKADIQRLWKKESDHVNNIKEMNQVMRMMMMIMAMMIIVWLKIVNELRM